MACQLDIQLNRVVVRSTGFWQRLWKIFIVLFIFYLLSIVTGWFIISIWWLVTSDLVSVRHGTLYLQDLFFSASPNIGIGLVVLWLWIISFFILILFACVVIDLSVGFSIHANGWVRTGFGAWWFPGPMQVNCIPEISIWKFESEQWRENELRFQLSYGASSIYVSSYGSADETLNLAKQLTQWAHGRISGIPDKEKVRKDNFIAKWIWLFCAMLIISPFVSPIFVTPFIPSISSEHNYFNDHGMIYLSEHEMSNILAVGAITGLTGFAIAGLHWLGLARRAIKASIVIWMVDVLTVLLLIIAGCSMAMYTRLYQDMRASSFHEVTLRQPVDYRYNEGSSCSLALLIQEPVLGRSVPYMVKCDQLRSLQSAAGIEVHQFQNEIGVHIRSVLLMPTEIWPTVVK